MHSGVWVGGRTAPRCQSSREVPLPGLSGSVWGSPARCKGGVRRAGPPAELHPHNGVRWGGAWQSTTESLARPPPHVPSCTAGTDWLDHLGRGRLRGWHMSGRVPPRGSDATGGLEAGAGTRPRAQGLRLSDLTGSPTATLNPRKTQRLREDRNGNLGSRLCCWGPASFRGGSSP